MLFYVWLVCVGEFVYYVFDGCGYGVGVGVVEFF